MQNPIELPDIPSRVTQLERRVDRLYNWGVAAFFAVSVLGAGYLWFFNKQYDRWEDVQRGMQQISMDIFVIKQEQTRQAKEADRAYRLVNLMIKKGALDPSAATDSEP